MPRHCLLGLLVLFFLSITITAQAQENQRPEDDKGIFNVVFENDIFAGQDNDYTNGVRFAWISPEENMPSWTQKIAHSLSLVSGTNNRISIAVGQSMFTPEDLSSPMLIKGDQPYVGWLYGSVGMVSDTGTTLENMVFTIGMIGPTTLAKQTQKFVHKITDSPDPKGWDNQLHNELGIVLTYERKWRSLYEISPFGLGLDVTPHAGVNLGNINTDASVGATFRFGFDLPNDYGPPRIRPSLPGSDFFIPTQDFSGYLFTTVEGRAVARNIFLDGNTFRDSPSVDKKNLVGSLQVGAAVTFGETRLSFTQVYMTKEYDTQVNRSVFGAVTLSRRF